MADDGVEDLGEKLDGLNVEDEDSSQPARVLDSLTVEGVIKHIKALLASNDS